MTWKVLCTVKFYTAVIFLLSRQITLPNGDMLFLGTLAADCPCTPNVHAKSSLVLSCHSLQLCYFRSLMEQCQVIDDS